MRVILIGFMGVGKTYVGKKLLKVEFWFYRYWLWNRNISK